MNLTLEAHMTDGYAATSPGALWTAQGFIIEVIPMSDSDLKAGDERQLQCAATCVICSHRWQAVMPVTMIDADGLIVPDFPEKVECPSCGGMYGELDV